MKTVTLTEKEIKILLDTITDAVDAAGMDFDDFLAGDPELDVIVDKLLKLPEEKV